MMVEKKCEVKCEFENIESESESLSESWPEDKERCTSDFAIFDLNNSDGDIGLEKITCITMRPLASAVF